MAAQKAASEGDWLRAESQTGGKGRQGRIWQSPPGNLYASTLVRLRPDDPPAPSLALVAAVALHEAASLHGPDIQIKWPNDLMVKGAKLAGILMEREGDGIVIGFGMNLAGHPDLPDRPATSLKAIAGTAPEPAAFLDVLADSFARWLGRWRGEGLSAIRRRWLDCAHPVGSALSTPEGEGLFEGLDETGALRLRLAGGDIRVIRAGDVFLV